MKRRLILNWSEAHKGVREVIEAEVEHPFDLPETGKGWTYLTFCPPGTDPAGLLFRIDRLHELAKDNGYHLPGDIVAKHNKVVVTAAAESPSAQLFGLARLLLAFARQCADTSKHPNHTLYGKLGGLYDRSEKGRVLAVYAQNDDALLAILETLEALVEKVRIPGVSFSIRLANGLSVLPRMLHGFDDPTYRKSGVDIYRITDPARFEVLLEQARDDYPNYLFNSPA